MWYKSIRIFPLFFVLACQIRPAEDKILTPQVTASFYQNAVKELESNLQNSSPDPANVRMQLDYYEKLGWPLVAYDAVVRAREILPLTPKSARTYADYFEKHGMTAEILELHEALGKIYKIPLWLEQLAVDAYLVDGERTVARDYLRQLYRKNPSLDHIWGAQRFMESGDSILAVYHFMKAKEEHSDKTDFINTFLPLLYSQGLIDELLALVRNFSRRTDLSAESIQLVAKSLKETGKNEEAKKLLWDHLDRTSLFTLSTWYLEESKFDSAHYCLDRLLLANGDDLEVLMRKGSIDESRGWLRGALNYYNQVAAMDSTYQDVQNAIWGVSRKIAYLRKIREAQTDIPTLDLKPKKKAE